MSEFEKLLKSIQIQQRHDERLYRETGCKTELLLRMEAIAEMNKEKI